MVNMSGWNWHKKNLWHYPDIESARRPVPHCSEVPVPVFTSLPDIAPDNEQWMNAQTAHAAAIILMIRLRENYRQKSEAFHTGAAQ